MAGTKSMTPEREGEFAAAPMSIVELYWMALDPGVAERARFARVLSPDERQRAERFRFPRDRWRYVVRRGRLRELLAVRLGCTPAEVPLSCNGFGKPRVEPNSRLQSRDLRFSLSHSGGLALYAIADGVEIGCDIEWRAPTFGLEAAAERFFSPLEVRMLRSLPRDQWAAGFFNCWTRKEAFVKARGFGLSLPLNEFDVSLIPGEPAVLLRGGAGWSVRALEPIEGLHAAIVAEGSAWQLASSRDDGLRRCDDGLTKIGGPEHRRPTRVH